MKGIEPSYSAWKAAALPLSYTRSFSVDFFTVFLTVLFAVLDPSLALDCQPFYWSGKR